MSNQISKTRRQFWVIINYLSIFLILAFFYYGKSCGWNCTFTFAISIVAFVFILSFIYAFSKTGLWKLVHTSTKKLDERQIQIVHRALQISYSIFVIFVLLIIYLYAIVENGPIDVVVAACLLYLSHTLPAAIVAWTEN